ncbi:MAG: DUF4157 domain-containing protein [Synechococcus sp.]
MAETSQLPEEKEAELPVQTKSLDNTLQQQTLPDEEEEVVQTNALADTPIQRMCVECEREQQEKPMLQTKLTVGQPGDRYEQEADRVADRVVSQLHSPTASAVQANFESYPPNITPIFRRHDRSSAAIQMPVIQAIGSRETQLTPPVTVEVANQVANPNAGEPLPPVIRRHIEPLLNTNLSSVRLHRSASAQEAAKQLGARAFTHGQDIFLGSRENANDIHLLAHEATHVVQQSQQGAKVSENIQRDGATHYEGVIHVAWSDDYAELYRRIVAATARSSDFAGIPRASMWQPFHTPTRRFHRRHSRRHLRDLNEGERVEIHVSGFYDATDTPSMSQVRIWHDEDIPAPATEPSAEPAPAPSVETAPAPTPPPDLISQGKIRWDEQTPERVYIIATGVTPRLIAADLYGDESLATDIWAVWDEEERGEPFTVSTELQVGMFVGIKYSRLRSIWRNRYDLSTTIIDREIWGARPPIVNDPDRSYEPYTGNLEDIYDSIAIHHAGNEGYRTIDEVQDFHIDDRDMADIGYHFGIDRWGGISEGRDISVKGAHIAAGNTGKIGIVLLADLDEQWYDADDEITNDMEASLLQLIHYLIGRFPNISFLGGHKEYNTSRSCPGNLGMARMSHWRSQTGLSAPTPVN